MKWDNTDFRVGLMVFGALVLGIVSVVWIGRQWGRNVAPLYTDVADVQGIGAESPVFLNGFNVGRVSQVRPHVGSNGQLLFRVRMDIIWQLEDKAPIPLYEGLHARVVSPALDIGRGSIVLETNGHKGQSLKPGDVIPSVQLRGGGTTNRMQLVVDSVGRDLRLVIASVERLVKTLDVTVASATATMTNANKMLASVNQEIPGIVHGVRANLASADSLLKSLHTVTPATVATLDSVRALLGDSRIAIARATQFLDDNEPQLASTLANLDQASAVLNNLLKEVSRRPIKALTGVKPLQFGNAEVRQTGQTGTTSSTAKATRPPEPKSP
jgi:ABC-type transporter Mla subunit MlaD